MQSQHYSMQRTQQSESLTAWVGSRPAASAPASMASAAPATQEGVQHGKYGQGMDSTDPRVLLLKAFLEWLTGRPIKLFDGTQLEPGSDASSAVTDQASSAPAAAPSRASGAGFGISYEYHASREEVERTDFAAQGQVATADGRRIGFSVDLGMARSYSEQVDVSVQLGDAKRKDPLVLNIGNSAAQLSSQRMSFDLNADGHAELIPLLASGAYLALDANRNGKIDSGAELFGPSTGAGFSELAKYDADHNGWIDEGDPIFAQLSLWKPAAEGNGGLTSLLDQNVGALFLGYQATPFELRGSRNEDLGAVRSSGVYLSESGQAGTIQQIDLTV